MAHKATNRITTLRTPNGQILSSQVEIDDHIISFFKNLLDEEALDSDAAQGYFENLISPLLSQERNIALTSPITVEEVELAVFKMKSFGSSGLDGFPLGFYQHFWHLLKDDIVRVVRESFESKEL